jgi:hypothetical protein
MVSSLETIAAHSWKGSRPGLSNNPVLRGGWQHPPPQIKTHKINTTICPTLLLNQPTTKSLSAPIAFGSRKADRKDGRSTIGYKLSYSLLLLLSGRRGRLRKRRKSPQNDHIHRRCSVCWNCLHVRQTVHDLWSYSPHSCRRDCGIPLVIEIDCTRPRAASATGAVFY